MEDLAADEDLDQGEVFFKDVIAMTLIARKLEFKALGIDAAPEENPLLSGFKSFGPLPTTDIFEGKPLKRKEERFLKKVLDHLSNDEPELDEMSEQDHVNYVNKLLKKPWEDTDLIAKGWPLTKAMIDGIRIFHKVKPGDSNYPSVPASPSFYVGQKPFLNSAGKLEFKKVRLICDERVRNKLSPISEHMSLPGHYQISRLISFALQGVDAPFT